MIRSVWVTCGTTECRLLSRGARSVDVGSGSEFLCSDLRDGCRSLWVAGIISTCGAIVLVDRLGGATYSSRNFGIIRTRFNSVGSTCLSLDGDFRRLGGEVILRDEVSFDLDLDLFSFSFSGFGLSLNLESSAFRRSLRSSCSTIRRMVSLSSLDIRSEVSFLAAVPTPRVSDTTRSSLRSFRFTQRLHESSDSRDECSW
jgi:hypothetical protein